MSLNSIKNKLVANCSKCDALCCNAMKFETPTYKKKLGVKCQNLNSQTLKCKIYEKREVKGYQFCSDFDCHGAGQAVTKLFRQLGLDWRNDKKTGKILVEIDPYYYRPTEVSSLVGDFSKAKKYLNWSPEITVEKLIEEMTIHDKNIVNKSI